MEDRANLIKRGTKARAGGCPTSTRLQKHAPASLEIDKVLSGRPANAFAPSADQASKAIPLLSPLILSPQTLYADTSIIQARTSENSGNGRISNSSSTPCTGWEHPAMAPFPEPSCLCSFLQKKCVLVNNGQ